MAQPAMTSTDKLRSRSAQTGSIRPAGLRVIGLIIPKFAAWRGNIHYSQFNILPAKSADNAMVQNPLPFYNVIWVTLVFGCVLAGASAKAAVSQREALALKSNLTPVGATRAGNEAGTIPAWTGGYRTAATGYRQGDLRPDPFAN